VAELELTIPLKSNVCKVGMGVMAILMPVWAIGIPFCLGLTTAMVLRDPTKMTPIVAILFFSILIIIPAVSVILAAVFEDDVLLISKEGMAFPLLMLNRLGFRRARHWSDLQAATIQLAPDSGKEPKGFINLFFKSGGTASIKIDKFTPNDLEQFLLAIEIWGQNCQRAPELIQFHNQYQNDNRGVESLSYTQMWEEELSRRFASTSFVPLEPGHVLKGGSLKIVRQLAFGGLSAIYLAQEDKKGVVVVKEAVIPNNCDEEQRAKALELFEREARFLVRLEHPQIAKVYDHFQEDGRNYLLLDYIRGQDLRQLVKQNGAQPEEKVVDWGVQIADILTYLHEQSPPIIHRDLTPDNLVLDNDGKVILIDFGAANEFVGTATGTLVGKQAYISPEQLRGKASTQSDIYALGGTLHFLLTGSDPEALSASRPKQHVETVSSAVDDLVKQCTEMEERDRMPHANEIKKVLAKLHEENLAKAPAATTTEAEAAAST
jgi:predicted Ser/Thr protein kinase